MAPLPRILIQYIFIVTAVVDVDVIFEFTGDFLSKASIETKAQDSEVLLTHLLVMRYGQVA